MKYHPKQLQIDYLLLPIQFWFYVFIFINQIRSYFPSDTRLNIKPLKENISHFVEQMLKYG